MHLLAAGNADSIAGHTPGGREAFMNLFAEDFVSVEYGSDVQGGVHRKTRADVFSGPPLPPAEFELSDCGSSMPIRTCSSCRIA